MATPVTIDLTGYAGISTREKDSRRHAIGKKIRPIEKFQAYQFTMSQEPSDDIMRHHSRKGFATTKETPNLLSDFSDQLCPKKRHVETSDHLNTFSKKWQADHKGCMALYLTRNPGAAHIEADPENFNFAETPHRRKSKLEHTRDNLMNDLSLTGQPDATFDILKPLGGSRTVLYDNPNGPFETSPAVSDSNRSRIDHLDRRCIPRPDVPETWEIKKSPYLKSRNCNYPSAGDLFGLTGTPESNEDETIKKCKKASVRAPWNRSSFE